MSSLGAQARAAELRAAAAAKQRQEQGDIEDQKLPPKIAAASLCDFTKGQPLNRNKGTKTWRPLKPDDIPETPDHTSLTSDSAQGTPTSGRNSNPTAPLTTTVSRQASSTLLHNERIKVNIPTAPRAMIESQAPATVVAFPFLQRHPLAPAVRYPNQQPQYLVRDTAADFHHGGLPYPNISQPLYSFPSDFAVATPGNQTPQCYRFGSMMVPDDISPTKQEEKFAMLGQNLQHQEATEVDTMYQKNINPSAPHLSLQRGSLTEMPDHQQAMRGLSHTYESPTPHGFYSSYRVVEQPVYNLTRTGFATEKSHQDYFDITSVNPQAAFDEQVDPTSLEIIDRLSREVAKMPTQASARRPSYTQVSEYEEPYDRKSRMQGFVDQAKQEAMSRKSKTVLHNPDLYKASAQEQESIVREAGGRATVSGRRSPEFPPPVVPWKVRSCPPSGHENVPWEVMPAPDISANTESHANASPGFKVSDSMANSYGNPVPGLLLPAIFGPKGTGSPDASTKGRQTITSRDPIYRIGSREWGQLGPMTSTERARTRACMAKAAAAETISIPGSLISEERSKYTNQSRITETQKWFKTDARGEALLREDLINIAAGEAEVRKTTAAYSNGGILPAAFKSGIDDGQAANILLGNVVGNLKNYLTGERDSVEQRRNFFKVKTVPDFCTERGGLLRGIAATGDSYFDREQEGYDRVPARIARDPRFRPQGREGLKVKPDEEWKHRLEMYGRRIM